MSQASKLSSSENVVPGDVAIDFVTDSGTAIASGNILRVNGAAGTTTSGSGNQIVVTSTGSSGTGAFSTYLSASVSNVTGDGTFYQIIFDTVIFDISSAYNNSTGVYTAPVTGKYLFVCGAFIDSMTTQTSMETKLVTTQNSFTSKNNLTAGNLGTGAYSSFLVSMTIGDTAYVVTESAGGLGGKTARLVGMNSPISTFFQGTLLF